MTMAASGVAALASVAEAGPPDMLLADLRMPQMDGDALAAKFRPGAADLKVLYLTGFSRRCSATAPSCGKVKRFSKNRAHRRP